MRIILYARKSTESEERQVQSIDDQVRLAHEMAERQGFQIVRTISESRSAKAHGKREGFSELLKAIEKRQADGILAWHPDRLARNAVDGAMVIDLLDRGKLSKLHFVSYNFENTPEGKFMLGMIFSQSKYVVDKLSLDVRRGLKSKILKGWFPHQAPEGYLNDTYNHTITVDPERFALLRKAWEMMLTGAYTGTQVRAALNQWGYRTRRRGERGGNLIAVSAVYKMFENPFYYGHFIHDGELYKGAHPPMVSEYEYLRVQQILGKANHIQPKTKEFAFTGLIRCQQCGCLVTAETKTKFYKGTDRTAHYTYYHCTNGKKNCVKRSVTPEFLEQRIASQLEALRIAPEFCTWALENLVRYSATEDEPDKMGRLLLERTLRELDRKREGLFEMRMAGEISLEEFDTYRAKLASEIEEKSMQQRFLNNRREREESLAKKALQLSMNAYERFTQGDIRAKREVAVALSEKYFLTLENLEISLSPLLAKIATFEPLKVGSDKEKSTSFEMDFSSWQRFMDNIRTSAREQIDLEEQELIGLLEADLGEPVVKVDD